MKKNKTLTAVEWLLEQYFENSIITPEDFKQAKELEKQQIIEASNNSYLNSDLIKKSSQNKKVNSVGEQYYEQTFNK